MRTVFTALCLLCFSVPAWAQLRDLSDTWVDKLNNDQDVDCASAANRGLPQCKGAPVVEVGGKGQPVRPGAQIVAGSVMLVIGPAISAVSSVVFLDGAHQPIAGNRGVEYAMGGVMAAAGVAIAIGGGATLRKGLVRRHEEAEMGLALAPGRLDFHYRF